MTVTIEGLLIKVQQQEAVSPENNTEIKNQ